MSCVDAAISATVYVGAVAPESLRIEVSPSELLPDLTVVTAATLTVVRPDHVQVTWALTEVLQQAGVLVYEHTFSAGDVNIEGKYGLLLSLTVPAGTVRTEPRCLLAKAWAC